MAKKKPKPKKKLKKGVFEKARSTEAMYSKALRSIGREVGKIIASYGDLDPTKMPSLTDTLRKYSDMIMPWARSKAALMIAHADGQDKRVWAQATQELGKDIRHELRNAPVGKRVQELMHEQVVLIKSIPTQAAERVHKLVLENFETQGRSKEIAKEIAKSGKVTIGRASTIARTEVARVASTLTQARAEHIGSDGYIWRTARDADVRHSHKKMEGKFIAWDAPPTLDGLTGHAGQLPNCRCYPEPVIPKDLLK